jgi:hypothetical protein
MGVLLSLCCSRESDVELGDVDASGNVDLTAATDTFQNALRGGNLGTDASGNAGASGSHNLSPGGANRALKNLPSEMWTRVARPLPSRDVQALSHTSRYMADVVARDAHLESSKKWVGSPSFLQWNYELTAGHLDPENVHFHGAVARLAPSFNKIPEQDLDDLIDRMAKVPDGGSPEAGQEYDGISAMHSFGYGWSDLDGAQRSRLFRIAGDMPNPQHRAFAFQELGYRGLRKMTPGEQRQWAEGIISAGPKYGSYSLGAVLNSNERGLNQITLGREAAGLLSGFVQDLSDPLEAAFLQKQLNRIKLERQPEGAVAR